MPIFGFGAGDEKVKDSKYRKFDPKDGQNYILSFGWWLDSTTMKPPETPTITDNMLPGFTARKCYFIQNVGSIMDTGSPEMMKLASDPPTQRIATVVIQWPTEPTKGGALGISMKKVQEGQYDILPWFITPGIYEQLKNIHFNSPFSSFDLSVSCRGSGKTRKLQYVSKANSMGMLRQIYSSEKESAKALAATIFSGVNEVIGYDSMGEPTGLMDQIARPMSLDKLREKLGHSMVAPPSGMNTMQFNEKLDDLLADD